MRPLVVCCIEMYLNRTKASASSVPSCEYYVLLGHRALQKPFMYGAYLFPSLATTAILCHYDRDFTLSKVVGYYGTQTLWRWLHRYMPSTRVLAVLYSTDKGQCFDKKALPLFFVDGARIWR